jgi:hypothetical protein
MMRDALLPLCRVTGDPLGGAVMTIHACLLRTGKTVVRRLAVLLAAAMILSGCTEQRLFAVKAVAAGVPSLAPFFEEDGSLGRDETKVRSAQPHSGLQQGNTPGLYGGTRKPKVCDVDRLKDFLTDPRNRQKAREWARVVGITPDRIEGYIDDLTPVLLRHDTLVKNHDYKKGEAVAYDALLEAGIAVLVNDQGLPAVKCSCGNPLRSFDGDPEKISVKFEDGNKKWNGYEKSAVVTVKPSPQPLEQIKLVNVDNPDQGIDRPVGSTGENDTTFDATERHEVPRVAGMTVDEAGRRLSELGIAVAYGDSLPPGDARVTGSDPGPGTPVRFGQAVALSVESVGLRPGLRRGRHASFGVRDEIDAWHRHTVPDGVHARHRDPVGNGVHPQRRDPVGDRVHARQGDAVRDGIDSGQGDAVRDRDDTRQRETHRQGDDADGEAAVPRSAHADRVEYVAHRAADIRRPHLGRPHIGRSHLHRAHDQ